MRDIEDAIENERERCRALLVMAKGEFELLERKLRGKYSGECISPIHLWKRLHTQIQQGVSPLAIREAFGDD